MERRKRGRLIDTFFPDEGELRRELYPKHLEFFRAGSEHRERCFMAANRVGKSQAATYELTLHLTGSYPAWWEGRRFTHPVNAWACGDTNATCRDILQSKLLGPIYDLGSGLIPGDLVIDTKRRAGTPDSIEIAHVRHSSGGTSTLTFKSYDSRREAFQGAAVHVIAIDEEPPLDIYEECLVRTMTTKGIVMCTFTPLKGMSQVVQLFLEGGKLPKC